MDPYEINLDGRALMVYPQTDGTYMVYDGAIKLARLYPDVQATGDVWESADISQDLANQIGELIEEHEL